MEYITTKVAAKNWRITDRIVAYHCSKGRIMETKKMGNTWLGSDDAKKTVDGRYSSNKVNSGENK